MTGVSAGLSLTGERTLPDIWHENYWFRRHEAAYLATVPWVRGTVVLDAGPGEGYGAALLARYAERLVSVDYDPATVAHARARYGTVVGPVRGDLQRLPLADGSVEAVVCLQVLEHLHDQPGFLRECARVLRPAGTLVLSTPNRLTFSPGRDAPLNPFHTREVNAAELRGLLEPTLAVRRLLGVRHGPRLRRLDRRLNRRLPGGLMAAQLAGPPESWAPALCRAVAGVRAADFTVDPHDVDTSLDLLAVAVRR